MAKKTHTLLAMLAGAALAGGYLYAKKMNEEKAAVPEGEGSAPEGGDEPRTDYGWNATYTDEDGNEISPEEANAELKEEAAKAPNDFKENAKAVGGEILTGMKKAYEDMKTAIADAQQAAADRRAKMNDDAEECDCGGSCCCEAAKDADEAAEEIKETIEEKLDDVSDAFEDIKEEVSEKIVDIKD